MFYADYGEAVRRMQVQPYFTWLLGCEVTTGAGHFIAFPIASAQALLPDTKLTDWPALIAIDSQRAGRAGNRAESSARYA